MVDRKLTTLWTYPRPRSSIDHPTAKPLGLLAKAIDASSLTGMVVLDPFAGSGSTLVAAAQAGRIGVGIELRPEYARVAVDRLAEATGEEPVQIK